MIRQTLAACRCLSVCLAVTGAALTGEPAATAKAADRVDFQANVAPILQQHCLDCHGPVMQLAGLRLDRRELALAGGDSGEIIKPGHSAESLFIQRLVDDKLGILMPPEFPFPPGAKVGLAEEKIGILKRWIDQGAAWPDGVSLSVESSATAEDSRQNALFAAIRAGDRQAVAGLLDDRSLVEAADKHGATPLMHAALYADAAMLQLLLERGAEVNAADKDGATPLMWAAGDPAKVRLLLDKGAKVDVRSPLGRTPLLIAATYAGNAETVRLLLERGAKAADQDNFGETPLTSAAKRGDAQIVRELIAAGADSHAGGRPPLAWAAEEGNLDTLACLLEHGAGGQRDDLNAALVVAAIRGPTDAVRLLLDRGADANVPAGFAGYTPLLAAAYSETMSTIAVKLLLDKGAAANAKAANGDTPLAVARKRGATEIVRLLEQANVAKGDAPASPDENAVDASAAQPRPLAQAIETSIALLQKCGPEFFRRSGCIACHQQSVTSLAVGEARRRGIAVDEKTAHEQLRIAGLFVKSFRSRCLQRVDHPVNSAPSAGYISLGLAAEGYPADENTDAMIIELAGRQATDGSWTAFGHRPPLEYSRIAATALALHALQLYGPPGLKEPFALRTARGRDWLAAAQPASNSEHAFRLLGLAWASADKAYLAEESAVLLAEQRGDGSWSQLPGLAGDAYATGLTLYALHVGGGISPEHDAYRRGIDYLLRTQHEDGSWHVRSRTFPFQPYFESGFPHGHDQWISATATGFATVALLQAIPLQGGN